MTDGPKPDVDKLIAGGGKNAGQWEPVALESATSFSPYWVREDPFYHGWLWDSAPQFAYRWTTRREVDEAGRKGLERDPDFVDLSTRHGKRLWSSCVNSEHVHRVVASLHAFHHATSRQLMALSEFSPRKTSRYIAPLWKAGVLQRSQFTLAARVSGRLPYLYALHTQGRRLNRLLSELDEHTVDRILGPGSAQPASPGRHVRHNMLTFELALRLLETQPKIVAISGEPSSALHTLLAGARNLPQHAADVTLHRSDGLRIAVEVAASRNVEHLRKTIRKWVTLFAGLPRQDSGLAVVILNAHEDRHTNMATTLRQLVIELTTQGTLRKPDGMLADAYEVQRARSQVHLASWVDWFPQAQAISEAGRNMHTAVTPDAERWLAMSLTDPNSYSYVPRKGRVWPTPTTDTSLVVPAWAGSLPLYEPDDVVTGYAAPASGDRATAS